MIRDEFITPDNPPSAINHTNDVNQLLNLSDVNYGTLLEEQCVMMTDHDPSFNQGTPLNMIDDNTLIVKNNEDITDFIMKTQGIDEGALYTHYINNLLNISDSVAVADKDEESVETENVAPDSEIILVPDNMIKQETIVDRGVVVIGSSVHDKNSIILMPDDMILGGEVVVGSNSDNEVNIHHNMVDTHLDTSIDIGSEQMEDSGFDISIKNYNCPSCSYSSQRRDKLDKHMKKHVLLDGVNPSGKKRRKPDIVPQRLRHNAEEYRCPLCPYSCTVYEALKNHQKLHVAGIEQFNAMLSCKICGKDRNNESDMQKHMKKHRNNEHFLCDLCNFSSNQVKKIIEHRRMHTGEKPHLCPHCSYRSARRDNLRYHVRRMHRRENMYIDTFNTTDK